MCYGNFFMSETKEEENKKIASLTTVSIKS